MFLAQDKGEGHGSPRLFAMKSYNVLINIHLRSRVIGRALFIKYLLRATEFIVRNRARTLVIELKMRFGSMRIPISCALLSAIVRSGRREENEVVMEGENGVNFALPR